MAIRSLERIEDHLKFVDQTALPVSLKYVETDDYQRIIEAIKRLEIRGAPAIGIAAAYGIAIAVRKSGQFDLSFIRSIADAFANARPTAVNLSWAVQRVVKFIEMQQPKNLPQALTYLWGEAQKIHEEDRDMCERIGKHGAELIPDGATILTHCHTGALATGGIGTALGIIHTCHAQGKKLKVYADETRPLLQGARLTAWELQEAGIDVTLICDNVAGMLMSQGKIDAVLVGADRITRNGDVANKIGTYSVAVLANSHNIPFYVAAPTSTFDPSLESGSQILIEERSPIEVTNGFGRQTAPDGVNVYSPAFDITPARFVTAIITDRGIERNLTKGK